MVDELLLRFASNAPTAAAVIVTVILFLKHSEKAQERTIAAMDRSNKRWDDVVSNCNSVTRENTISNIKLVSAIENLTANCKNCAK